MEMSISESIMGARELARPVEDEPVSVDNCGQVRIRVSNCNSTKCANEVLASAEGAGEKAMTGRSSWVGLEEEGEWMTVALSGGCWWLMMKNLFAP